MNKRQSFEGLVLRALNMLLHIVARHSGQKANERIDAWKADVRAYLDEPWEPSEEEIAYAEIMEHYGQTLQLARELGKVPW